DVLDRDGVGEFIAREDVLRHVLRHAVDGVALRPRRVVQRHAVRGGALLPAFGGALLRPAGLSGVGGRGRPLSLTPGTGGSRGLTAGRGERCGGDEADSPPGEGGPTCGFHPILLPSRRSGREKGSKGA